MKHVRRPFVFLIMVALLTAASPASAQETNQDEFDDIIDIVTEIRGLELLEDINLELFTQEELAEDLQETLFEDYPPEERYADEREMVAFGLVDEDIDLSQLLLDLYSEQVAGYYNFMTSEMVVVRSAVTDEGFTAMEEITFAHEVVHALQDQHFDLDNPVLYSEDHTSDQVLAIDALVEGDAVFSELSYLLEHPSLYQQYLDEVDIADFDFQVLENAPAIISEPLLFPYDVGFTFIDSLHQEGGMDAVNAAFENPPASTEQVLHPEKYIEGEEPISIEIAPLTEVLGADWEEFADDTFGEYQLRVILNQTSMSEQQATVASAGWGGDTYFVAGTDTEDAIHFVSEWDTEQDAEEFARAWALFETERLDTSPQFLSELEMEFESDEVISRLIVDGTRVTYAMAPDAQLLETILAGEPANDPAATPAG